METVITYADWKLDLLTYDTDTSSDNSLIWAIDAPQTYRYTAQFFAEANGLLNEISPEELNKIFWFLSHDVLNVQPEHYPDLPIWQDYLGAIKILFRDLFNIHCAPVLGHRDEQPTTPLNSACYMWWDILPVWHSDENCRFAIQSLCLEVMTFCLSLGNLACKESALHGLGHWYHFAPREVERIIQEGDRHIPPPLKNYAKSAQCGCVL
ncbi:hypothetical protein NIES970_02720 [[Synechococcus] sp. NIES-970]|nr:hypothetical protein NIES970_02720 [[Synechococcus] sp. NIES-970]